MEIRASGALTVESMSHCKYEGFHETQVRKAFVWVLSIT